MCGQGSPTTLVSTACGAADALLLMWESFNVHHARVPFIGFNNSGWQDEELARVFERSADLVLTGPNPPWPHGKALDALCAKVTTPYTLIVDSDVEFRAPVLGDMLRDLQAGPDMLACFLPDRVPFEPWTTPIWGHTLHVQHRINPALVLFDTRRMAPTLQHFSWSTYFCTDLGEYFDAGALLYRAGAAQGWQFSEPEWLHERVVHYGGISKLTDPDAPEIDREIAAERYAVIQERLQNLRREREAA